MNTRVQKWGNSQGLRLAKHILEQADIAVGDEVNVTAKDGLIVISPVNNVRGKYKLDELVSRIPAGYRAGEVNWGKPAGKEAW